MPPAELGIRLKTSLPLRRLVPTPLVVARARRQAEELWERGGGEREDAEAAMAAVLGATHRAPELAEIAREHLIHTVVERAYFWQPWRSHALDEDTDRRLREAVSSRRGVILSCCHIGPFYGSLAAFGARGYEVWSVSGAWFFEQPSHDYWGRRLARWRKGNSRRLIPAPGSFPVVRGLLASGGVVSLYLDMPGPRPTRFLGKAAMLADGIVRLATLTDALILPLRSRRAHDGRAWLETAAPLDPRDFADADALHQAMADVHERLILEIPEQMDDPRDFGWDEFATPLQWRRPAPEKPPSRE